MPVCNTGGGYTMDFQNTLPQRVFTPATESITLVTTTDTQTLAGKTFTTPVIDGVTYSANNNRQIITTVVPIVGSTVQVGTTTLWTAPAAAIIQRVILNITTQSLAASTLDIGYTATTATTSSDTLLDGVSGAAVALFDSMNAALDSGANAKAQLAASAKWITVTSASGDTSSLIGNVYIEYILV